MNLAELFPGMPTVVIKGVEYEVKFTTRSTIQLQNDYPDPRKMAKVLRRITTGIKAVDLMNLLYACLLDAKAFEKKDDLIDATVPRDFEAYAGAVFLAYMQSSMTKEQYEKLEVLSANAKKKAESEIMPGTTHFIEYPAG